MSSHPTGRTEVRLFNMQIEGFGIHALLESFYSWQKVFLCCCEILESFFFVYECYATMSFSLDKLIHFQPLDFLTSISSVNYLFICPITDVSFNLPFVIIMKVIPSLLWVYMSL
jgi:hypothetical protein